MQREPILYVDDDHNNLIVFRTAFLDYFDVCACSSAEEALSLCERREFPVIIADQRMPGMKGTDFLEIVKEKYPLTIRMILTAYTDVVDVLDAINKGSVYKYLTKPWRTEDLLMTLHRALEAYHLSQENRRLTDQLIEAAKLSVLGQFSAGIAHEIRNELSLITLAELIREKYPKDEMLQRYSAILLEARDHLLEIVNEVTNVARGVEPSCEKKPVPLAEIIQNALSLVRYDRNFDGKTLVEKVSQNPVISGDKGKLRQVFINVLQNAAHATDSCNQGVITIETLEEPGFGVVAISDNGCGIAPENMARIWEPFFTTKQEHGTGLGLDICQKILHAHNGRIECTDSSPDGTTFKVWLPLHRQD